MSDLGYKFYDPTIKSIPTTVFDSVQASILVIVWEADMKSQQDNVELPTHAEIIVPEEQTQQL